VAEASPPTYRCPEVPGAATTALASAVPAEGHTRSAIVQLLLEGPITAGDIGHRLGISAAGVRRHLDALVEAGDAEASAAAAWQHNGRGRPAKRYRLTAAGRAKLSHPTTIWPRPPCGSSAIRRRRGRADLRPARIDSILGDVQAAPMKSNRPPAGAEALTKAGTPTTPHRWPARCPSAALQHTVRVTRRRGFPEL
jgi:DNA-binding transcriptional ArsR family regulator